MGIKLEIKGINVLLKGLDDYGEDVQKLVAEEVRDWAERTESDAKRDVPRDTNALANSIRAVLGSNGLTWIVKVGGINGVDYAPYVVFGTGGLVDQQFLQQYGLVQYASQFKGKGERLVNLPMRDFLYRNASLELTKSVAEIKKIIANAWK